MLTRGLVVLFAALSLMACSKTRSAAIVVAKEHIEIAEPKPSPKLIQVDRAHYGKLKVGDRIKVAYYRGKYTGTVWAAEIED